MIEETGFAGLQISKKCRKNAIWSQKPSFCLKNCTQIYQRRQILIFYGECIIILWHVSNVYPLGGKIAFREAQNTSYSFWKIKYQYILRLPDTARQPQRWWRTHQSPRVSTKWMNPNFSMVFFIKRTTFLCVSIYFSCFEMKYQYILRLPDTARQSQRRARQPPRISTKWMNPNFSMAFS